MNFIEKTFYIDDIKDVEEKMRKIEEESKKNFCSNKEEKLNQLNKELEKLKSPLRKMVNRKKYDELLGEIKRLENLSYYSSTEFLDIQESIFELQKSEIDNKSKIEKERHHLLEQIQYIDGIPFISENVTINPNILNMDFGEITLEDLSLVHASTRFPSDNTIIPASDKVLDNNIKQNRLTTHFSLNGRVGNHANGNWDNCPFVIIEPFESHAMEMSSIVSCDTFKNGALALGNKSIILVERGAYQNLTEEEKKGKNIVLFENNSTKATDIMLVILGYKPQNVETHSWQNQDNDKKLRTFVTEKLNISSIQHSGSIYKSVEMQLQERDKNIMELRNLPSLNYDEIQLTDDEITQLTIQYLIFVTNINSVETIKKEFDLDLEKQKYCTRIGIKPDGKLCSAEEMLELTETNENSYSR